MRKQCKAMASSRGKPKEEAAAARIRLRLGRKETTEKTTFIVLQKNTRSLNSSEGLEELFNEVHQMAWDAILISEIWRQRKEIWETQQGHIMVESGNSPTNTELRYCLWPCKVRRWRQDPVIPAWCFSVAWVLSMTLNYFHVWQTTHDEIDTWESDGVLKWLRYRPEHDVKLLTCIFCMIEHSDGVEVCVRPRFCTTLRYAIFTDLEGKIDFLTPRMSQTSQRTWTIESLTSNWSMRRTRDLHDSELWRLRGRWEQDWWRNVNPGHRIDAEHLIIDPVLVVLTGREHRVGDTLRIQRIPC